MKAVIQRVIEASVTVDGAEVARIGPGLLVLLGVAVGDDIDSADRMAERARKAARQRPEALRRLRQALAPRHR